MKVRVIPLLLRLVRATELKLGLKLGLKPVVVALFIASGCATYSEKTTSLRDLSAAGRSDEALAKIDEMLKVSQPSALPDNWERDTPLLVLERATLLQTTGENKASAINFSAADKELDLLDLSKDAIGKIGKYIYSDSATKYQSTPTEKLTLNALNLVNYLVMNDLDGARVEGKRMTVMQKYLADNLPDRTYTTFGSYLAAFTAEHLGEHESAIRYYDEALVANELGSVQEAVARLASKTSYRTDRLSAAIESANRRDVGVPSQSADGENSLQPIANEPPSDVLVVLSLGRSPYKIPHRLPIGAAISLAHGYFTGDPSLIALLGTKFVNFPELVESNSQMASAHVKIDGQEVPVEMLEDLRENVVAQHEVLKPRIIGAAITRLIARAATAEGVKATGNAVGGRGNVIGLLASLAVEGSMVALDRPDTRSWTMMPRYVLVARKRVAAGEHRIEITPITATGAVQGTVVRDVATTKGGFAVVQLADPR